MTEEHKPLSPEEVAEIAGRVAKASSGPWTNVDAKRGRSKSVYLERTAHEEEDVYGGPSRYGPHRDYVANTFHLDNADFIAHARQDIPRLITTIAAKEAEIADLRRELAIKDALIGQPAPDVQTYSTSSLSPDPCTNGHDKCYSPNVIMTNPPIHPWVCRRCPCEGADRGAYTDYGEYELLRQRKAVPQGEEEKP